MEDKFATYVDNRRLHNFLTLKEYVLKGKVVYKIYHDKAVIQGRYSPRYTIYIPTKK